MYMVVCQKSNSELREILLNQSCLVIPEYSALILVNLYEIIWKCPIII